MAACLGGGGGEQVAAVMLALPRPNRNLADRIFTFCMKTSIVLSVCYFAVLVYIAISEPEFGRLTLLPFFSVAVIVPCYAGALLQEYGS